MVVGVRRECIRIVPSDEYFRLDMKALAQTVAADREEGFNPLAICANAGTASSGAVNPLEKMADYCAAEGIWQHVGRCIWRLHGRDGTRQTAVEGN